MAACRLPLTLAALHAAVSAILMAPAMSTTNVLFPGEQLRTNEILVNGGYTLIMQEDCNLVVYRSGTPLWASAYSWHQGTNCYTTVGSNGELLIYGKFNPRPVWSNRVSSAQGDYALVLQNDGRLFIYGPSIWSVSPTTTTSYLGAPGADAAAAASLSSGTVAQIGAVVSNGGYKMSLLDDCNLIVSGATSNGGKITWETATRDAMHDCYVALDSTGELSIKYMGGEVLWTSGAKSQSGEYVLAMKSNGTFAVYGASIWKSTKNGLGADGRKIAMVTDA